MAQEYIEVDENHRLGWDYDEGSGSDNPREWSTPVGFAKVRSRSRYIDVVPVHDDPTSGLAWAHLHFEGAAWHYPDDSPLSSERKRFYPSAEEITERWARIFYDLTVEYDSEYEGYWFVDPDEFKEGWDVAEDGTIPVYEQNRNPDGSYASGLHEVGRQSAVEFQKKLIDWERKQYEAWAQGHVFYVFGQRRVLTHTEVALPDGSKVREVDGEEWENEDSIGGIYSDDYSGWLTEEEVLAVAKEYFGKEYTKKEEVK